MISRLALCYNDDISRLAFIMRSLLELNPLLEGYYATYDGKIISRKNKILKQFRRNKQSRCPYLSISVWDKNSGFARPFLYIDLLHINIAI